MANKQIEQIEKIGMKVKEFMTVLLLNSDLNIQLPQHIHLELYLF